MKLSFIINANEKGGKNRKKACKLSSFAKIFKDRCSQFLKELACNLNDIIG